MRFECNMKILSIFGIQNEGTMFKSNTVCLIDDNCCTDMD